ncbi:ankyrin repeat domain-containing protein 49-like [Dysidea avara]|uniref:ankyrin repeat domain-containing protein 49-like n=1 Tax=Dysidea avara TaxID=196820 RepID=UPI0033265EB3
MASGGGAELDPEMWKSIIDHTDTDEEDGDIQYFYPDEVEKSLGDLAAAEILFLTAAEKGNIAVLNQLHAVHGSQLLEYRDEDGYTSLHRAAYNGHVEMTEKLLQIGANVMAETNNKWQPLHCACKWDKVEVASLLLQNNAHVNAQSEGGQTPLHLASSNRYCHQTMELLLTHPDIDPSLRNNAGETAYDIALRSCTHAGMFEIVDECIRLTYSS